MSDFDPMRWLIYRDPSRGFDLNLYVGTRTHRAEPIVMVERPPATYAGPCATLTDSEAQGLMDSLWDAGIRPTQGHGSAGERAAMTKHLDDMRRIAFLYVDGGKP
jgi:hypothetical protein